MDGLRRRAVGTAAAGAAPSSTNLVNSSSLFASASSCNATSTTTTTTTSSMVRADSSASPFEYTQKPDCSAPPKEPAAIATDPAVLVPAAGSAAWAQQVPSAAAKGDTAALQRLLAAPAQHKAVLGPSGTTSSAITSTSSCRSTVLSEALSDALWAKQDAAAVVLLASSQGASATATLDSSHNTPLHIAARQGCEAAVRALLASGARLGSRNKYQQTALHCAAAMGHVGAARVLLLQGAAVDAATREGVSPLIVAVQGNHPGVVALLLSHGADPLHQDDNMKTALYWAAVLGCRKIVQALCDHLTQDIPADTAAGVAAAPGGHAGTGPNTSSSRRSPAQVVAAIRSCAMAAFAHNQVPAFAVFIKEIARRDPDGVKSLFQALGASHCPAAAAAVAICWAQDATELDQQRVELQARAADIVAERMASQQLLLAVASAAKQLEHQQSSCCVVPECDE